MLARVMEIAVAMALLVVMLAVTWFSWGADGATKLGELFEHAAHHCQFQGAALSPERLLWSTLLKMGGVLWSFVEAKRPMNILPRCYSYRLGQNSRDEILVLPRKHIMQSWVEATRLPIVEEDILSALKLDRVRQFQRFRPETRPDKRRDERVRWCLAPWWTKSAPWSCWCC